MRSYEMLNVCVGHIDTKLIQQPLMHFVQIDIPMLGKILGIKPAHAKMQSISSNPDWILPIVLDVLLRPQTQPKIRLSNLFNTLVQTIAITEFDLAFSQRNHRLVDEPLIVYHDFVTAILYTSPHSVNIGRKARGENSLRGKHGTVSSYSPKGALFAMGNVRIPNR
ncbi:hypothetical protein [Pandoraea sp. SD6-2]|uniref:hypothetical protein n=1 Tax=Pandoraea sp. SD6-2 TaxID=1286093 RepID=UPI0011860DDA|nr:hypothetical protein [Pandoraea sp. SD6-2]